MSDGNPNPIVAARDELNRALRALATPIDKVVVGVPPPHLSTKDDDKNAYTAWVAIRAALVCLSELERGPWTERERSEEAERIQRATDKIGMTPTVRLPDPPLIHVRFDHMPGERNFVTPEGGEKFLARYDLPAVPAVGELVNIEGQPYRVLERSWSAGKDDGRLYAFVKVR